MHVPRALILLPCCRFLLFLPANHLVLLFIPAKAILFLRPYQMQIRINVRRWHSSCRASWALNLAETMRYIP